MRTQLNSETEGEKWLEAGGGLPSAEALFADALLASYRRAIESVAAARTDIRAAAHRLAAIWRAGGRLVYLGAGSSGLAAAADAAELPGTFGLDESHIAIILAGGASDGPIMQATILDQVTPAMRIYEECMKIDAFSRAHPLRQPGAPAH